MAEQLGLQESLRQRRAIHRNESTGPATGCMGVASKLFLASSGFSSEQDRQLAPRGAFQLTDRSRHRGVLRHEPFPRN